MTDFIPELLDEAIAFLNRPDPIIPPPTNPMAVARTMVSRLPHSDNAVHLQLWRGAWYRWSGDRWIEYPIDELRGWLYQQTEHSYYTKMVRSTPADASGTTLTGPSHMVEQTVEWQPTDHKISNVLNALGQGVLIREAALEEDHVIAVENGVLELSGDTETLLPHSPRRFNLSSLPYAYDKFAFCPTWLNFLESILPGDAEAHLLLQEWFGYVISGRMDLQKMLSLVGPPRCGKGTIARVLQALLGPSAYCSPEMSKLSGGFGEAALIGKALAVFSDVRWEDGNIQAGANIILAISGQDIRTIARKYQSDWTGALGVRFMAMSNDTPSFRDTSGALANRMLHIHLRRSFLGREDPSLIHKLLPELPGILNWALDGLRSLTKRGYFQPPSSSQEMVESVARIASPVGAFVSDECELGEDFLVELDMLYQRYGQWCIAEGRDYPLAKETFSKQIRSATNGMVSSNRKKVPIAGSDRRANVTFLTGLRMSRTNSE